MDEQSLELSYREDPPGQPLARAGPEPKPVPERLLKLSGTPPPPKFKSWTPLSRPKLQSMRVLRAVDSK